MLWNVNIGEQPFRDHRKLFDGVDATSAALPWSPTAQRKVWLHGSGVPSMHASTRPTPSSARRATTICRHRNTSSGVPLLPHNKNEEAIVCSMCHRSLSAEEEACPPSESRLSTSRSAVQGMQRVPHHMDQSHMEGREPECVSCKERLSDHDPPSLGNDEHATARALALSHGGVRQRDEVLSTPGTRLRRTLSRTRRACAALDVLSKCRRRACLRRHRCSCCCGGCICSCSCRPAAAEASASANLQPRSAGHRRCSHRPRFYGQRRRR